MQDPGHLGASRGTDPAGLGGLAHSGPSGVQADDVQNIFGWLHSGGKPTTSFVDCPAQQAAAAVPAPPPIWSGKSLSGEFVFRAEAATSAMLVVAKDFLTDALPAEVETYSLEDYRLQAIAFIDYVPLHLEMRVYSNVETVRSAVAVLRNISKVDVVRFRQFIHFMAGFYRHRRIEVDITYMGSLVVGMNFCTFDDADMHDDELVHEAWLDCMQVVLADAVGAPQASVREEAVQALARCSETRPDSRRAIAQAMVAQEQLVVKALCASSEASLSEAFPLSVALRFSVACPEAAAVLASSQIMRFCEVLAESRRRLITLEVSEALACMKESSNVLSPPYSGH